MTNKNKAIASLRLYDDKRDQYIYSHYVNLPSKTNGVKDIIACGLKIKESAPFLYQLLTMKVNDGEEITIEELEDIINMDKKYSLKATSRNDITSHNVNSSIAEPSHSVQNEKKIEMPAILKNLKK